MKASVLVINFNSEKYINKCLESLKKQSYKNLEIIFFDDCSEDRSLIIARKFKNIKIIKNISHSKYGSFNQINALQRSFNVSKGDIIFFLDSDDFFHPKKIEMVIEEYRKNKNLNILFDLPIIIQSGNKNKHMPNLSNLKRFSYFPFFSQQSCLSLRRREFKKIFPKIVEKIYPNVWVDFRIAIYANFFYSKVSILEKYLTYYRRTPQNISSKFTYLSKSWWSRRLDYHLYTQNFAKKNGFVYKNNLDLLITIIVNKIITWLKKFLYQ